MKATSIIVIAMLSGLAGSAVEDILTMPNMVFSPPEQKPGTPQTWEMRCNTDNSICKLLINAQGTNIGAVPNAYAMIELRTQDEVRIGGPGGKVVSSNDMHAGWRLMSRSFGFSDPLTGIGACSWEQCPEMAEFYSGRHLRFVAEDNGAIDMVVSGMDPFSAGPMVPFAVNRKKVGDVALPLLRAAEGTLSSLCTDDAGTLVRCPARP